MEDGPVGAELAELVALVTHVVQLAAGLGVCIVTETDEKYDIAVSSPHSYPPSTLPSHEKEVLGIFSLLKIGKSMPARPSFFGKPKFSSSPSPPFPSALLAEPTRPSEDDPDPEEPLERELLPEAVELPGM